MQEAGGRQEKPTGRVALEKTQVGRVVIIRTENTTYRFKCVQQAEGGKLLEFQITSPPDMVQRFPYRVSIQGDFVQGGVGISVLRSDSRELLFSTSPVLMNDGVFVQSN